MSVEARFAPLTTSRKSATCLCIRVRKSLFWASGALWEALGYGGIAGEGFGKALGRFGKDLGGFGKVWEGFGRLWEGVGEAVEGFGRLWEGFGRLLGQVSEVRERAQAQRGTTHPYI